MKLFDAKKYFFYLALLLCPFISLSQGYIPINSDSLLSKITQEDLGKILRYKDDTTKVLFLQKFGKKYFQTDHKFGRTIAKEVLKLSKKLSFDKGMVAFYLLEGSNNVIIGKNELAIQYYDSALQLSIRTKNNSAISAAYNNKGNAYKYMGEYEKAVLFYFKSLEIARVTKNKIAESRAYDNLSSCYYVLENNEEALKYGKLELALNTELGDKPGIADAYLNIALPAERLGNTSETLKNYAFAIKVYEEEGDFYNLANTYINVGVHYKLAKNYDSAKFYNKKANTLYAKMEATDGVARTFNNLGHLEFITGNYNAAIQYGEKALAVSKANGLTSDEMQSYDDLTKAYKNVNNTAKALENSIKYNTLRDSLISGENLKQIAEMQAKYEHEKLNREKAEITTKNLLLNNENLIVKEKNSRQQMVFGIITALILLAVIIIFFLARQKQARVLLEQKKEEEKKRINAMLVSEENERARIARELHDGLGQLLSAAKLNSAALKKSIVEKDAHLLDTALHLLDLSVTEVRSISHNLMPQMLIEKGLVEAVEELVASVNASKSIFIKFDHSEFNGALSKSVEIAIYRVIQEVLNNMIKHSLASHIDIKLVNISGDLKILISDNGKGFDTQLIEKSAGIGWKNILTRLSLINGRFDIDSQAGKGTVVNIEVAL